MTAVFAQATPAVRRVADAAPADIDALAARYGVDVLRLPPGADIPGSYWGAPEAGLVGNVVYVRADTPLHSLLHELCHVVCMTPTRRAGLERDAGGDDAEECAVCYLQVLLADALPALGRERLLADMDAWGYSFRLGAAARWFAQDAADARDWLLRHGVIDAAGSPTGRLRGATLAAGTAPGL